ncbi:ankyrin repeat-containing domain protein [Xylariales sp. AK1849]|nr:ankyrin repeat-containing domain protein [Xylariales sp. AK1849]
MDLKSLEPKLKDIVLQPHANSKLLDQLALPVNVERKDGSTLTACHWALQACIVVLQELDQQLEPLINSRLKDKLKWPLEYSSTHHKLDVIKPQNSSLELMLSMYQARRLENQLKKPQTKREETLSWYKTSDPEQNHWLSKEKREPNTGAWVIADEQFRDWKKAKGELLWLHGIPGAGKTVLCSTIIDHMQECCAKPVQDSVLPNRAVYFYFDFSDSVKQTLTSLLKSAISQLLSANPTASEAAEALYRAKKNDIEEPSIEELLDVLLSEVACTETTFFLIDALDECPREEGAKFFDQLLNPILAAKINVLITSRKDSDIERGLGCIASYIICIQDSVVDAQTFRWAVCQLETIKQCLSPAMIRGKLKEMPEDLDGTYDRILYDIPCPHRQFVQSALHWLAFSARPLLLEELAEAVVIRPESSHFDAETYRLLHARTIVDLCAVLVTSTCLNPRKDRLKWLDEKGEIETRGRQNFSNRGEVTVRNAVSCTYLSSTGATSLHRWNTKSTTSWSMLRGIGSSTGSQQVGKTAIWLSADSMSDSFKEIPGMPIPIGSTFGTPTISWMIVAGPLYWAAALGDMSLVRYLVEQGADITAREGYFESAFGTAVFGGYMEVVEFLLRMGLGPNIQGTRFGSPLQIAVVGGSWPVVQRLIEGGSRCQPLLIGCGAELNVDSQTQGSALVRAAAAGDIKMTTMLIGAGADVNDARNSGKPTALYAAVESGSLPLVHLLIRRGADVNKGGESTEYRFRIVAAAHKGESQMVRALLMAGADPNIMGRRDSSALSEAIGSRDMATFRTLLDAGADVNAGSDFSENCFQGAIQCQQMDMAKMLIQRGAQLGDQVLASAVAAYKREPWVLEALLQKDVDVILFVKHSGSTTTTALHVAVHEYGNEATAQLLLERGAYVHAISQSDYTTPLCLAIRDGMTRIAQNLIGYGADIHRTINFSPFEMAICHACDDGGTLELANMLIELGVDINRDTEVAPFWPLHTKNTTVLRYLADKGINLNRVMLPENRASGGFGYSFTKSTPIQYAAKKGDVEMVQLLLDLGAQVDGVPGSQGSTLHYGILYKKRDIVGFLLNNGANIDDSTEGCSVICKAVASNLEEFVSTLLQSGGNVNANEDGQSPLAVAFSTRKPDLVDLLRRHGAHFLDTDVEVGVNTVDKRSLDDLKTLLDLGYNPNTHNQWQSAVQCAASKNDTAVIQLLVEYGAVLGDSQFKRALGSVCKRGHVEMATFLLDNGAGPNISHALLDSVEVPNNLDMVEVLLQRKADVLVDEGKCFQKAAAGGCRKILTRADVDHRGTPYGGPLQAALSFVHYKNDNQPLVIKLLIERGADVNPPVMERPVSRVQSRKVLGIKTGRDMSTTYSSPLSLAITGKSWTDGGLHPLVDDFLALGADVNGVGGEYHAPLQAAAYFHPAMLGPLLDAGADLNDTGGKFGTALHAAACKHNVESVKLLLARGADVHISAGKYGSVLQAAAKANRFNCRDGAQTIEVMELLFEAGADVQSTDGKYGSAVQMAAVSGNIAALKWLASKGADIRVKGGRRGNAYRAALKNLRNNKAVEWGVVSWIEQHCGREGWDEVV